MWSEGHIRSPEFVSSAYQAFCLIVFNNTGSFYMIFYMYNILTMKILGERIRVKRVKGEH